jgi:glycosyltransferase involved in cell wall biosynthesis
LKVLLDALQAGNQSGTGRYTEELLKGLPLASDRVEVRPFVPANVDLAPLGCSADTAILINTDKLLSGSRYRDKGILMDIKAYEPDIVHYTATIGSQAKRRRWDKSKVILTVHDVAFMRHPEWFKKSRAMYYKKKIRKSLDYADQIIADSCATADDLMHYFSISQDKIDVVPLGVDECYTQADEDSVSRVLSKYKLPERFYLYVGTIEPRKNIARIVEAFTQIADESDLDLVIAGRDGWKVKPIYKAIEKSSARDRIHLPGFIDQDDLPAVYSSAEVFVWPSLWEGFGLPPLESMACGTPVITSTTSSLPEVVGHAAAKVDPENTEQLATWMKRMIDETRDYKGFWNMGLNQARRFPWRITAEMTLDVYKRALDA